MDRKRAIRLAERWSIGLVCTLIDGEAEAYHKLCLSALKTQEYNDQIERVLTEKLREVEGTLKSLDRYKKCLEEKHPYLIDAEEEPPESKVFVLAYGKKLRPPTYEPVDETPKFYEAYLRGLDEGWFTRDDELLSVTYWMPMPIVPKRDPDGQSGTGGADRERYL